MNFVFRDDKKSIKQMFKREAKLLKKLKKMSERERAIKDRASKALGKDTNNLCSFMFLDSLTKKSKIQRELKEIEYIKLELGV